MKTMDESEINETKTWNTECTTSRSGEEDKASEPSRLDEPKKEMKKSDTSTERPVSEDKTGESASEPEPTKDIKASLSVTEGVQSGPSRSHYSETNLIRGLFVGLTTESWRESEMNVATKESKATEIEREGNTSKRKMERTAKRGIQERNPQKGTKVRATRSGKQLSEGSWRNAKGNLLSVLFLGLTKTLSRSSLKYSQTIIDVPSSEDEALHTPPPPPAPPKKTRKAKIFKLSQIQNIIASKTEKVLQQAEPTVLQLNFALTPYKKELTKRMNPALTRIRDLLDPCLLRVNLYLHGVIMRTHERVREVEQCLVDHLPDCLLNYFASIPLDEKEPFKIHSPNGLSICFFALNLTQTIFGLWVFLIGVFALTNPEAFNSMMNFNPTGRFKNTNLAELLGNISYVMILFGGFMLGLGYLGVIGCIIGQRQMLRGYAFIVCLFIAGQAAAVFLLFFLRNSVYYGIAGDLQERIKNQYEGTHNSTSVFSQLVDLTQFYFSCCGVLNYTDFEGSPWYKEANKHRYGRTRYQFPISCCKALGDSVAETRSQLANSNCQEKPASLKNEYTMVPCKRAFIRWVQGELLTILGLLLSFIGLEMSAITNAMAIVKKIDQKHAKRRKKEKRKTRQQDNGSSSS